MLGSDLYDLIQNELDIVDARAHDAGYLMEIGVSWSSDDEIDVSDMEDAELDIVLTPIKNTNEYPWPDIEVESKYDSSDNTIYFDAELSFPLLLSTLDSSYPDHIAYILNEWSSDIGPFITYLANYRLDLNDMMYRYLEETGE